MFCIECGTKLDIGQKFCKNCGSPINFSTEKKEPVKTINTTKEAKNTTKKSGKKNSILYSFGYGLFYILVLTPMNGLPYAVGAAFVPWIILLASTGIPNKNLRNFVMGLFSVIFFFVLFGMGR